MVGNKYKVGMTYGGMMLVTSWVCGMFRR